jgi:hypothetical protein
MTVIVLFDGAGIPSAQAIVRTLDAPLCWFRAANGAIHDVGISDLLSHAPASANKFVPTRPAIWPDLEMALDTMPVDAPEIVLLLDDGEARTMIAARAIPILECGGRAAAFVPK